MKITKEQYEQLKDLCGYDLKNKALELDLLTVGDVYGYGIEKIKVYEKDNEFFLDYTTYDSCD